jgi:hypothetical protein
MSTPKKRIFYSDLSLAKNELLDARIENTSTAERLAMSLGAPHTGLAVWDTDLEGLYIWHVDHWVRVGATVQQINNWNQAYNDSVINFTLTQGTDSVITIQRRNSPDLSITYRSGYIYNQGVPSDTWVINHNLNKNPSVTIVSSAGEEVEGAVVINSLNQITITFCAAFSGKAYLN